MTSKDMKMVEFTSQAVLYFHTVSYNSPKMMGNKYKKVQKTKKCLSLGNDVRLVLICKITLVTRLGENSSIFFDQSMFFFSLFFVINPFNC